MRVLLIGLGSLRGHVQPMIALADHLQTRGCEVAWWSMDPAPDVQLTKMSVDDDPRVATIRTAIRGLTAPEVRAHSLRKHAIELNRLMLRYFDDYVRLTRLVIRSFRPDVVAVDGVLSSRMVGCHLEGVPFAAIGTGLHYYAPPDLDFPSFLLEEHRAAFQRHGAWEPDFREWYCASPYSNIVFSTEALVGALPCPPRTHLVGHAVLLERRAEETRTLGFPLERLSTTKPIVYAAFGSIHDDISLARIIAEATKQNGAQLVLAAGRSAAELRDLGDDAIVVENAPQLDVLRRARVFVTHGGANSLMEALYMGVPLVMTPLCTDQPLNGFIVRSLGARSPGVVVDPESVTLEEMRKAIHDVLVGPYRANAESIGATYRARDGGANAARLVMDLAGTKLPPQGRTALTIE